MAVRTLAMHAVRAHASQPQLHQRANQAIYRYPTICIGCRRWCPIVHSMPTRAPQVQRYSIAEYLWIHIPPATRSAPTERSSGNLPAETSGRLANWGDQWEMKVDVIELRDAARVIDAVFNDANGALTTADNTTRGRGAAWRQRSSDAVGTSTDYLDNQREWLQHSVAGISDALAASVDTYDSTDQATASTLRSSTSPATVNLS